MKGAKRENMALVLGFFKAHKTKTYCMHEIAEIFDMTPKDASNVLHRLSILNTIRVSQKTICRICNKKHFAFIFWKGSSDYIRNLKFLRSKRPVLWVNGSVASSGNKVLVRSKKSIQKPRAKKKVFSKNINKDELFDSMISEVQEKHDLEFENRVMKKLIKYLVVGDE